LLINFLFYLGFDNDNKYWFKQLTENNINYKSFDCLLVQKNDIELRYIFDNFKFDHTFTNSKEIKRYNNIFTNLSLRDELGIKEKLSIPSLLGFDNVKNITYLRVKVIEKYPSLINFPTLVDIDEDTNPKILAAKKTNERATKSMKRKGKEISNVAQEKKFMLILKAYNCLLKVPRLFWYLTMEIHLSYIKQDAK
jgi:hypothetical protein